MQTDPPDSLLSVQDERLSNSGEPRAAEQALRAIVEGTATATGDDFFYALVRALAAALGVRYAFVAELCASKTRTRTLAFWANDHFLDNFEYDLAGTPCEIVSRGETVYYTHKVYELFPAEPELTEMGIESYFGVPLLSETGLEMGHLAVLHDQPMVKEFRGMALLRIFATRARVELERLKTEQALRHSEGRLAGILAGAMDAIITIDGNRRISLFNAAAEKAFHCRAVDMQGQPITGLLSAAFTGLLDNYCQAATGDSERRQIWAPAGLTARRWDTGQEFPVEATFSAVVVGGNWLYTLILRDLTERQQAEKTLRRLQLEKSYLQEVAATEPRFEEIIGRSLPMQSVFDYVAQVAATDATVLLTGETGTGKEVIARAIHDRSRRQDKLLVKVNCAALPAELVESELFGHEKGAFTGALAQRKGRFEMADGGTLFLDEVGELAAPVQAKLLRILQEQEFERVGGTKSIKVDVRVIAATNRNLADMVKDGSFRSDLFYRLHVFPIKLPPLRERREDIPLLVNYFLKKFSRKMAKPLSGIAPAALEQLLEYPWPGNVRELQNVIERAVILARGLVLEVDNALELRLEEEVANAAEPAEPASGSLEAVERAYILKVLEEKEWVIEGARGAATVLRLKPSTLRSRMQKLNIRKSGVG